MKGDFSRFTFDPSKHFSAVRLQQGRVQLDADWNEQLDITAHRIETEITDFIGQSGAPDTSAGFAIQLAAGAGSLTVGHGRYYVDGMLFELDADASFSAQPDFPGAVLPTTDGRYLAYLDAWQCHLSALDDPRILEPALGDAETATRIRNLAQVKLQLLTEKDSKDPKDYLPPWQPNWDLAIGTGALAARVSAPQATLENQLYRVEIHQGGGADKATFKWSRDNGSVGARVKGINGQVITLRAGGPGAQTRFAANQWVEVITQAQTLRGESGVLAELAAVQVDELTVSRWPNDVVPISDGDVVVRRWDSSPGEIAVKAGPIPLEDGIEVHFDTGVTARYKAGDYWLIPARNLTGNVEWPRNADQSPLSVHPHGVVHHYCALALLTLSKGKWSVDSDLRVLFKPIATGLVSKGGDTVTGSLNVLGNVGIGTTAPQARFHVQGDATAQGSGASSVPPALCRMTDGTGASQFLVSPKGDVDARGKLSVGDVEVRGRLLGTLNVVGNVGVNGRLEVKGDFGNDGGLTFRNSSGTQGIGLSSDTIFAAGTDADQSLALTPRGKGKVFVGAGGGAHVIGNLTASAKPSPVVVGPVGDVALRIIYGLVLDNAQSISGRGYSVSKPGKPGIFDIVFDPPFASRPSASVTQIFPAPDLQRDQKGALAANDGGDPRDNAVIVGIDQTMMRVKTGGATGVPADRHFSFVVVGPLL